ncbi:choice-of-anchor Q domain-containing protein [uncultured Polaribacter sp.]|uniref:InlB B-repeat-containing protein n=1 Tax=uncultured Polaribacter sp. TaxID=174711 RepID=UPI0026177343|nr:choice-of-anchor Q domain-containing protein [uncultured Polaribacter sp.]
MKTRLLLLFLSLFTSCLMFGQIPTNGLQSQYTFTNGAFNDETNTTDLVKTGTALTNVNGVDGSTNNAVSLNGDYLKRNTQAFNDFSISFAIKTSLVNGSVTTIIDQSSRTTDANDNVKGWYVFIQNGKIGFAGNLSGSVGDTSGGTGYNGLSGYQNVISTTNIADGNWHQVTVTVDESTFRGSGARFWRFSARYKVYIDRVLENNQEFTIGTNQKQANSPWANNANVEVSSNNDITIGNNHNATLNNSYAGIIDEVLIYNRILSTLDIELIADASGFCFKPSSANLTVLKVDANSIELNLSGASKYDIAYHKASETFLNAKFLNNVDGGEIIIPYLEASTAYNFYFRKICSNTQNSEWSDPISATTLTRIYVDVNASGNNDGSSWANAQTNLKDALDNNLNAEFWVKSGTYIAGNTGRNNVFALTDKQAIYGGFNGTELTLSDRLPTTPKTILSGDINGNDDNTTLSFSNPTRLENNHRIIVINGDNIILDGITISGGNADSSTNSGAAIWVNSGNQNLTINNCEIKNNSCLSAGIIRALDTNNGTNLTITNTSFSYNFARLATIYYLRPANGKTLNFEGTNNLYFKNKTLDSSTDLGNNTLTWFRNDTGNAAKINATFINSTFADNSLEATGASFDSPILSVPRQNILPNVKIYNCIFWGNTNNTGATTVSVGRFQGTSYNHPMDIQNSIDEDGFSKYVGDTQQILTSDPLFVDTSNDNFKLTATSPAIDYGNNSLIPIDITTDLNKRERIFNTTVDLGPYEFNSTTLPTQRILSKIADNGFIVTNPNPNNGSYDDGAVVTITAKPKTGFKFDSWSGDVTSTDATTTITMDADKSIVANFSVARILTLVATNGSVSINTSPTNGYYEDNTQLTLTAIPDAGYQFFEWTGDASGTTNPLSITMDADKTLVANFIPTQYALNITSSDGTITTNPNPTNGTYDIGTVVTVTATPNTGVNFVNWTGDASGNSNLLVVTMDSDKNITANYAKKKVYVDIDATGGNNGTSWANAYTSLATALTDNNAADFWVAEGIYIPGSNRTDFFTLKESQHIYGGFNGTETMQSEANSVVNETILSGDINRNDNATFSTSDANRSENSYRIININGANVIIDGFTISNANANGSSSSTQEGSGINVSVNATSVKINNCKFKNHTLSRAGIIRSIDIGGTINISIKNTVFVDNQSVFATCYFGRSGGGSLNLNIEGALITNNTATTNSNGSLFWFRQDNGGSQTAQIVNSTFVNNNILSGTPIINYLNSVPTINIYNSIFWENTNGNTTLVNALQSGTLGVISNSISNKGFTGNGNTSNISTSDPLFEDSVNRNYILKFNSPAIDTGDNSFVTVTKDLFGTDRVLNTTVDIGAFEFDPSTIINRNLSTTATNGSITTNPNPINGVYIDGTTVSLTATPDAGYQFDGWSGDATGTTNPLNITMDADKSVTALFSRIQRTLTITATNGSVSTNPSPVNGTYDDGTVVTLTATPDAGYQFDGWSGDAIGTTNPLDITMDADKSVTALFSRIQRTLTITATNGTVTTNPSPVNGTYDDGTVVTLTATPDAGYQFDGWSGDAIGTTNPLDITMDADKSVTALFSRIQRSLTITSTNGSVSTNPSPVNGTYDDGTVVTLTATPDAGYQFDGFRDDISGANLLLNSGNRLSTTITLNADKSVTALFSRIQRTLTIISTNGTVTTNPSPVNGTYDDGTVVTLTATPDAGYQFDGFRDDISGANLALNRGNPLSTTITLNTDKSITALFSRIIQRSLTITATNGTVTTNPSPVNGTYDDGTVVTLTATPNAGFALVNWTIDGATLDNSTSGPATSITVTMDADKTVAAVFDATASVDDELINSFSLYPNPTNNVLNISTDLEIKKCKVYNVIGKKVLQSKSKEINVTNLPKGMYLIQIITAKGKSVTKKFVKK